MSEEINVRFVIPKECVSEDDCCEEMKLAFTACEPHIGGGLQARWVHEKNFTEFNNLTKKDVIVLSQFDGEIFQKLKTTKCLLVGPRCLSCSLIEGTPIPQGPGPVFTIAMRGLIITASGLTKTKKENIQQKVHWMGGIYKPELTENTTHLVADNVISDKYIQSVKKGIPIMKESWIEAVWSASLKYNVNGASTDFNEHRLPPFYNLNVTTSGLSRKEKHLITTLVNDNGGIFSGAFQSETTDVVVLTKDSVGSEKYKAALEYGKACVVPAWVKDSAARGVALPMAKYKVLGASTSSPLAEHRLPDMSLNFSRITNSRPPSNFVDETRSVDLTTLSGKGKLSQESKRLSDVDREIISEFEKFDMSCLKKAGPIFDGFCIWVSGLDGLCRERAAACVSRCGGVRYDCAGERVTHAAAGTRVAAAAAARALPAVPVLSALWLLRSAEAGRALPETEFLMESDPSTPVKSSARKPPVEAASPMSKRNLQLLRLPPPTPEPCLTAMSQPPEHPEHPDQQDDIVNHYLSQNVPEAVREKTPERVSNAILQPGIPDITEDLPEDPTEEIEQIFRGVKLEVQGLEEEAVCEVGAEVSAAGGVLCAAGAGGAYVLVPLDFDPDDLVTTTAEPVTVFWVKDCLCQQELLPLQYYHRPVRATWRGTPLAGVVASLSTYSGVERAFLDELAKLLGATTQLRFCRRTTANALASTHLICPSAAGDKYAGAVKWHLPAVTAHWLLACACAGKRVSERPYLVGDTKAPPTPEHSPIKDQMEAEVTITEAGAGPAGAGTDKENEMLPPAGCDMPRRSSLYNREETPKARLNDGDVMSPASRYIAMARQGLLGCDSQETPKRLQELRDEAKTGEDVVRTPPLDDALSSPNLAALSPTTRRRLRAVRCGEMPSDPIRTPTDPFEKNPATPDSGFGAALRPGSGRLSPDSRKRLWKVVNDLPSKPHAHPSAKEHTPLSEIRNRFLAQFNSQTETPPPEHIAAPRKLRLQDQPETPPPKMPKLFSDQTASSINAAENEESVKSESSATSCAGASGNRTPLPAAVDAQLQRLTAALNSRSSQKPKRSRDSVTVTPPVGVVEAELEPLSQPNTVGWDDGATPPISHTQNTTIIKRFMLSSNVDNREEIASMIQYLGGEVSECSEMDARATHLLCAAPGRSEKMLGCVAAGRWVLHPAYVARSRAAGRFLQIMFYNICAKFHQDPLIRRYLQTYIHLSIRIYNEEEFEWGNPIASCLPAVSDAERSLAAAAHRWRSRRAAGGPGPFTGMVALLHVTDARRRLLARLIQAGDGLAPDDQPPYKNEEVNVCFADVKRYPLSGRDAAWLTSRRVPICPPVLLSSYLTDENPPNPHEHCLPEFKPK